MLDSLRVQLHNLHPYANKPNRLTRFVQCKLLAIGARDTHQKFRMGSPNAFGWRNTAAGRNNLYHDWATRPTKRRKTSSNRDRTSRAGLDHLPFMIFENLRHDRVSHARSWNKTCRPSAIRTTCVCQTWFRALVSDPGLELPRVHDWLANKTPLVFARHVFYGLTFVLNVLYGYFTHFLHVS